MQVTAASGGESGGSVGGTSTGLPDQDAIGDVGFIRGYLDRIAHLEKEIRRLKEVRCCTCSMHFYDSSRALQQ